MFPLCKGGMKGGFNVFESIKILPIPPLKKERKNCKKLAPEYSYALWGRTEYHPVLEVTLTPDADNTNGQLSGIYRKQWMSLREQ